MILLHYFIIACLCLVSVTAAAFPLQIRDHRGENVRFAVAPKRIVSLTVGSDEILWQLLPPKERKRIIALSGLSKGERYSNIAAELPSELKTAGDNLETIIADKPDLVLVAPYTRPELLKQLTDAKVKTFMLGKHTGFEDIVNDIKTIGLLLGKELEAMHLANSFQEKTNKVTGNTAKPKILNFDNQHILYGKNTLFDAIVEAAGGLNAASLIGVEGWQAVSLEKIVVADPAYIVVAGEPEDRKKIIATLKQLAGWKSLKAVKQKKIVIIPTREMEAVSHHVSKAVVRLRQAIHGAP